MNRRDYLRLPLFVSGALLAFAGAPSLARAEVAPDSERAEMRRQVFDQLGLSSEQKQQLKQIHEQRHAQEKALREDLGATKKQLAAALTADGTTDDQLRTLHQQLAQKREAIAAWRFDGLIEVRKVLSTEQRRHFGELYLRFRQQREAHGGDTGNGAE